MALHRPTEDMPRASAPRWRTTASTARKPSAGTRQAPGSTIWAASTACGYRMARRCPTGQRSFKTEIPMMDFSAALAAAKTGAKVRRVSWEQAEWLVGAYMRVTVLTDPDGESLEAMVMVYPDGT